MSTVLSEDNNGAFVWLVWGFNTVKRRMELLAVATTPEARDRYLAFGKHHNYDVTEPERVYVDHLFARGLLDVMQQAGYKFGPKGD